MTHLSQLRVMIAGGGTGGHVYPGVAMYQSLVERNPDVEVQFVGVVDGMETQILSELNLPLIQLPGRGLRRASLWSKLTAPLVLLRAIIGSVKAIRRFNPDVVIGTGGYASVSTVIAAVLTRRPRVLQEQNSVPGLANRRLARFADMVLLSFGESSQWLPSRVPRRVIGNPLRRTGQENREAALKFLDLDPALPTVLIAGGSRGARSINLAAADAVCAWDGPDAQWLILCGERDYDVVRRRLGTHAGDARVRLIPYLNEVHHAYSAADVAVARAGASTVFELAAFGVPTVFVPYPYAADQHQQRNAAPLVQAGAALVIDDSELSAGSLTSTLVDLLNDTKKRSAMNAALRAWAKPDAADQAAEIIAEVVKKKNYSRVIKTPGMVAELRRRHVTTLDGISLWFF